MNDSFFDDDTDDELYIQGTEEAERSMTSPSVKPSTSFLENDNNQQSISSALSSTSHSAEFGCLRRYFGHAEFRPHQLEIITSVVRDKRDQCIIMATGSGKSLCYQFPSLLIGGVTVVISPLISLMEDQVQALNLAGIEACFMGSAQKDPTVRQRIMKGFYKIVYLTPEFVEADVGSNLLNQISSSAGLTLIAIDEAHCISQWGHEFRSSYRKLGDLRRKFPRVPFIALTATATPQVQRDIIENLHFLNPLVTCTSFNRANLFLEVFPKAEGIAGDIKRFMKQKDDGWYCFEGSTIIYCPTRKQSEEVCRILDGLGCNVELYHAGLSLKLRTEAHKKFINDECDAIVATVAFGMGIDKPDVRRVIHYGAPKDIESYYQEIGRAGRDGMRSVCSVVYSNSDFMIYNHFLSDVKSPVFREHKQNMQKKMQQLLVGSSCRRSMLLSHFEGAPSTKVSQSGTEACCDNCRRLLDGAKKTIEQRKENNTQVRKTDEKQKDFREEASILFQSVQALNGRYGLGMIALVIRGSHDKKVPDFVKSNKAFGAGNSKPDKWWKAFAVALKLEGYLVEKPVPDGFGNTIGLSDKARFWLLKNKDGNCPFLIAPTSEMISVEGEEEEKHRRRILREHEDSVVAVVSSDKKILPAVKIRNYEPWKSEENPANNAPEPAVSCLELEGLLMNKLTTLRTSAARDADLPPYLVASNRALFEMARIRPTTLESLGRVEDFPEARLKKFGLLFVNFIVKFCDEHPELSKNLLPKTIEAAAPKNPLPTDVVTRLVELTPTVQESYRLVVQEKKSMAEVARIRCINEATVAGHLADAIRENMPVDVESLGIDKNAIALVLKTIRSPDINSDITRIAPIKEKLGDNISWAVLKIVLAILEYEYGLTKERKTKNIPQNEWQCKKEEAETTGQSQTDLTKRKMPSWMGGKKKLKSSIFK